MVKLVLSFFLEKTKWGLGGESEKKQKGFSISLLKMLLCLKFNTFLCLQETNALEKKVKRGGAKS